MNQHLDVGFAALAHRIAVDGPERYGEDLARLAVLATARGVAPAAVEAMLDPASARVVKQRAFARIVARLGRSFDRLDAA